MVPTGHFSGGSCSPASAEMLHTSGATEAAPGIALVLALGLIAPTNESDIDGSGGPEAPLFAAARDQHSPSIRI
jgi:hypothetical protein